MTIGRKDRKDGKDNEKREKKTKQEEDAEVAAALCAKFKQTLCRPNVKVHFVGAW